MKTQLKNKIVTVVFATLIMLSFFVCIFKPVTEYSSSERKNLADFPKLSLQTLLDKSFQNDFKTYVSDQFPLRDGFRTVKALFQYYVLGFKENNGLVVEDGYIAKVDNNTDFHSIENAIGKFSTIYTNHLASTGAKVYLSIIPDKNYFISKENGYPSLDYESIESMMQSGLSGMTYIDLFDSLELSDYYKTDTHWSQDQLGDAVNTLMGGMGAADRLSGNYTIKKLSPFYGIYHGQSALPLPGETLAYLTNDVLKDCIVYEYKYGVANKAPETPKEGHVYVPGVVNGKEVVYDTWQEANPIYREDLFAESNKSKDPYNVFMGGASALPLLRIHNPNATTDKTLVLFRDSFGSSIAPLMAEGYSDVILVDLRYASYQSMLNVFPYALELDENTDVLFLYSTIILNNSYSFQ